MPEVKTFIELNQKLKPLTGRNETAKRLKEIVGYLPSEKAGFVQFTHKLRKYVNGLNPEGWDKEIIRIRAEVRRLHLDEE